MDQTIKDSVAWLKDLAHPGAHLRLDSRAVKPISSAPYRVKRSTAALLFGWQLPGERRA